MSEGRFSALLSIIVPSVVELIVKNNGMTEIQAAESFYRSHLYAKLSDEATKFWHYSALTLYSMYEDEISGRSVEYPMEAY